jgi:hypothetical protein
MIYLENLIPERAGDVIPIGDLHFSDKSFRDASYKKLFGYRDWIKKNPNARVVLGGDMFNVATRGSRTSPFSQRMSVNEEMNEIVEILAPIKKQIAGAIEGNHEWRAKDFLDLSLTETLCGKLDIPYMGISGVICFKVGKKSSKEGGQWEQNYYIYFHHTTGGGATIGGGLNRVEKLGNIIEGVDCYCGFHNHKLSSSRSIIYKPNPFAKRIEERIITHLTCGGYLQYKDSYAEEGMLRPTKLGSPKIELDGTHKHDLHVSL